MEFLTFIAQKDDENRRFDRLIKKFLPQMPVSVVQKNIRTGFIRLNHKRSQHNSLVHEKDSISIARILYLEYENKSPSKLSLKNESTEKIHSLFKNEHLWIVHKEAGLLSQKAKKTDRSLNCILKEQSTHQASLSFTPSVLHRLDKETSGIIVFSQSLLGAKWFSNLIQNNSLGKKYLGIAEGSIQKEISKEEISKKIKSSNENFIRWEDSIDNDICITETRRIEEGNYKGKTISLMQYNIITGKKHQIRKQSALHGLSLLGDAKYGGFVDEQIQSFYLHAFALEFPPNDLGIPLRIFDPLPKNFIKTSRLCLLKLDSPFILEEAL